MTKRAAIANRLRERVVFLCSKAVALDYLDHEQDAAARASAGNALRDQAQNLITLARQELDQLEEACRD